MASYCPLPLPIWITVVLNYGTSYMTYWSYTSYIGPPSLYKRRLNTDVQTQMYLTMVHLLRLIGLIGLIHIIGPQPQFVQTSA